MKLWRSISSGVTSFTQPSWGKRLWMMTVNKFSIYSQSLPRFLISKGTNSILQVKKEIAAKRENATNMIWTQTQKMPLLHQDNWTQEAIKHLQVGQEGGKMLIKNPWKLRTGNMQVWPVVLSIGHHKSSCRVTSNIAKVFSDKTLRATENSFDKSHLNWSSSCVSFPVFRGADSWLDEDQRMGRVRARSQ